MNCTYELNQNKLTVGNSLFSFEFPAIASAESSTVAPKSRSLPYFEVRAKRENGSSVAYQMWEDLPMIRISNDGEEALFTLHGEHWIITRVKLNAFTDEVDTLTEVNQYTMILKGIQGRMKGDIFFFEEPVTGEAYIIISETPDHVRGDIQIGEHSSKTDSRIVFNNGGYPVVIGKCKKGECEALCRSYFRHANNCPEIITMSNTWGDCNSATRVCESFIEREIEAAGEIGLDIVQIDDGWQAGNTLYVIGRDERGNRVFDDPCWDLNTERFPNGIMPLAKLAESKGMKIGMWFAPSSHNCFAHLERDKAVLTRGYKEYGARFFKLDMYQAEDKAHVDKMLELLEHIYSLGDDVSVQMDVTRYERLNYLCGREYGTIFVENRYTKTGGAFPHRVLRNLWDISRYQPTNRFQFELVNPDLNKESYYEEDVLAPQYFGMDYLFATVMLCNPLFWMELQFLSKERRAELAPIMKVWKQHRALLSKADVMPIGEKPSGVSHTGFYVSLNGRPEYMLVFREYTDRECAEFELPVVVNGAEVIYSNTDTKIDVNGKKVSVEFANSRSYAFIKLS